MIVLLVGGCFCRLFENHQKKSHLNCIAKNAAVFVQVLLNCVKNWQNSESCKVRLFSLFQPLLIDFSILHESSDENCLQAFPVKDNSLFGLLESPSLSLSIIEYMLIMSFSSFRLLDTIVRDSATRSQLY